METFSRNLFFSSGPGSALMAFSFFAILAGSIALYVFVSERLQLKQRRGLTGKLEPLLFISCVFGPSALWLAFGPDSYGEAQRVVVDERGAAQVVRATFSTRGKYGQEFLKTMTFTTDGERLGSRNLTNSALRPGPRVIGRLDGVEVVQRGDELFLGDPQTLRTLVAVHPVLDERYGRGGYRVTRFEAPALVIELKDGRVVNEDLTPLLPPGLPLAEGAEYLLSNEVVCATADRPERDALLERAGLLRPRAVLAPFRSGPCSFPVGDAQVMLVLHRSTAFGDDGEHLLSAVNLDGFAPLWSVPLAPALGSYSGEEIVIYAPAPQETALCFWLLRGRRSLSRVCVEGVTGAMRSSAVVF